LSDVELTEEELTALEEYKVLIKEMVAAIQKRWDERAEEERA
jgi:hypothetical protein